MSPFQANRWVPIWSLGLVDVLTVVGGGLAAAWIRFLPQFLLQELTVLASHPGFILYAVGAQLSLALTFDLYRPQVWKGRDEMLVRMGSLAITLPLALTLGVYFVPGWLFGRGLLILTLAIALPLQALARFAWLAWGSRPPQRRAVLIGDGPIVTALLDEINRRPWAPFRVVGHLPSLTLDGDGAESELSGSDADLLIVASVADGAVFKVITALNFRGTAVVDAAGAYAELTGRIPVQQVDSRWFIATGDFSNLATSPFHNLQRLFDLAIAAILLVLASPVLLVAALIVLVTDGPPVIYRQTRLGRFRMPFTLYKLRTMHRAAEDNGPEFAARGDSRILPLASFLRRWRIDELPQLINVLKGDMSLVGPRPERPEVTADLERTIPFFGFRYSVRPGLTGWAQVNHPYCATPEDHRIKLEYDLYSLRQHGPMLYLLVLLRTMGALVFSPGR